MKTRKDRTFMFLLTLLQYDANSHAHFKIDIRDSSCSLFTFYSIVCKLITTCGGHVRTSKC